MPMTLIIIICVVAVVLIVAAMYMTYNNKAVALRKEADAQKGKIESVHDKMWKVIKQKAEVSEEYRKEFDKIYPEIIAGRYQSDDASTIKFIQEANPDFDTSLYADLMQAIAIQREHFNTTQERMLDIKREHETLCRTMPATWFISAENKLPIEYEVISSTKSKTIMETGLDDDVNVFQK